MKTFRILLMIGSVALITSCGTTKDSSAATSTTTRSEIKTIDREATSVRNSRNNAADRTDTIDKNRIPDSYYLTKMENMYSDLDMSKDQITRFESQWKETMDNWKRTNPRKKMNNYERVEYQDQILSNILDDSQFQEYQKWAIENVD